MSSTHEMGLGLLASGMSLIALFGGLLGYEKYKEYLFTKKYIFTKNVRKTKNTKYVENYSEMIGKDYFLLQNFYRYELYNNKNINFVDECGKCLECYENNDRYSSFHKNNTINIIVKFNKNKKDFKKIFKYAKKDGHKLVKDVPYEIIGMIKNYL